MKKRAGSFKIAKFCSGSGGCSASTGPDDRGHGAGPLCGCDNFGREDLQHVERITREPGLNLAETREGGRNAPGLM